MANFQHGLVSIGATATKVCTIAAENDGVLVQNTGATAAFLGGPAVAASGANQGIQLAANALITIPSVAGTTHDLWAITASGTTPLVFLFPESV